MSVQLKLLQTLRSVRQILPRHQSVFRRYVTQHCVRCVTHQTVKCKTGMCFISAGLLSRFFKPISDSEDDGAGRPEGEEYIVNTIKLALLSIERDELQKAEQLLHFALKMAQETHNEDGITYVYDVMANLAFKQGQLNKAEKLFVETMKRMIDKGEPRDANSVVNISLKIASIYASRSEFDKASSGFEFCIGSQEKKIANGELDGDTVLLLAMAYDWYSRLLVTQRKLHEAQSYLEKAYNLSSQVNGPTHDQTLVLLNDIGGVCSMHGDYDTALQHLQTAIKHATETNSIDLPSFYVNVGAVYLQKGLFSDALKSCDNGRNIARKGKNKEVEGEAIKCLEEIKKAKEKLKS